MNDDIATWIARQEITEVIHRFARGLDRCDEMLLREAFHPGATDDHGIFKGSAEDFIAWALATLRDMARSHHSIGNVLIEIVGDKAFAESYFRAWQRLQHNGTDTDLITAGRYLDRFERRDGVWAIVHRHAVYDWTQTQPASDAMWRTEPMLGALEHGVQGEADASYRDRDEFLGE